jgi:hypothetical protein
VIWAISVTGFMGRTVCMHVHGRIIGTESTRIPALVMKKGGFIVPHPISYGKTTIWTVTSPSNVILLKALAKRA